MKALKKILACGAAIMLLAGLFTACKGSSTENSSSSAESAASGTAATGKVYFFNFKPEQDAAYQSIAKEYTEKTGVQVKIVTAASGTYEQQLKSEMAKSDAPTIFQINGPVGYSVWKDYCADLSDSKIYSHLQEGISVVGDGSAVYGIPFAVEGYGLIVNTAIMEKYFSMAGAKATTLEEIKSFNTLKAVAEDMQAKKEELGIQGVFAATSLNQGEDWRWQTHLANIALAPELKEAGADMTDPRTVPTIEFKYADNYKNLFDLYLNHSTIDPKLTGSKNVSDSMAEFALGQCAMVQNGNWAYSDISKVDSNTVKESDVAFLPLYMGLENEESQGIAIGTENFFCINSKASQEDQKASLDFLNWLYTSDEGKKHVIEDLGFIAPFDSFTTEDKPSDPLGQAVVEWQNKEGISNVPWDFTIFPSQNFKDSFGAALAEYAKGTKSWEEVKQTVIQEWASEKSAISV